MCLVSIILSVSLFLICHSSNVISLRKLYYAIKNLTKILKIPTRSTAALPISTTFHGRISQGLIKSRLLSE
jgi:hypothetical protein